MTRFARAAALLAATLAGSVILSAPTASAAFDPARTVSGNGSIYLPVHQVSGMPASSPSFPGTGVGRAAEAISTPAGPVLTSNVGTNAIVGPDDRVQVTPTTSFPASAVVLLKFNGGQCTGFMISARAVATSGDCVYSKLGRFWRNGIVAYPGSDGTNAPFGGCPVSMSFSPTAPDTTGGGGSPYDIGVVWLGCGIGNATGWFGLAPMSGLPSTCTIHVGYPTDKPAGTQWGSRGGISYINQDRMYHTHDTAVGDAGGPIILGDNDWCGTPFRRWPSPPAVRGINSFDPTRPTTNGVPIDGYVFNYLMTRR